MLPCDTSRVGAYVYCARARITSHDGFGDDVIHRGTDRWDSHCHGQTVGKCVFVPCDVDRECRVAARFEGTGFFNSFDSSISRCEIPGFGSLCVVRRDGRCDNCAARARARADVRASYLYTWILFLRARFRGARRRSVTRRTIVHVRRLMLPITP